MSPVHLKVPIGDGIDAAGFSNERLVGGRGVGRTGEGERGGDRGGSREAEEGLVHGVFSSCMGIPSTANRGGRSLLLGMDLLLGVYFAVL